MGHLTITVLQKVAITKPMVTYSPWLGQPFIGTCRQSLEEGAKQPYLQVVYGLRCDDLKLHRFAEGSESGVEVLLRVGGVDLVPPHVDSSQPHLQAPVIFMAELQSSSDRVLRFVIQPEIVFQMC